MEFLIERRVASVRIRRLVRVGYVREGDAGVCAAKNVARADVNRVCVRGTGEQVGVVAELSGIDLVVADDAAVGPGNAGVVAHFYAHFVRSYGPRTEVDIHPIRIRGRDGDANVSCD